MPIEDEAGDQLSEFLQGTVTRLALVGGGLYVLWRLLSENKRLNTCKRMVTETTNTLETLYTTELSSAEYQTIIESHRNMVVSINSTLPQGEQVDVQQVESDLQGRPLDTQAVTWVSLAQQQAYRCIAEEGDENAVTQTLEGLPAWARNLIILYVAVQTLPALITIIEKLLGLRGGGGGGALDVLSSWRDMVRNEVIGDPAQEEQIDSRPQPVEQPTTGPSGAVSASPRAIVEAIGNAEVVLEAISILGIAADAVISVSGATVDVIVQVTDLTAQQAAENPALVLAVAVVLAVAGAAITGSGGSATPVALAIAVVTLAVLGVSLDTGAAAGVVVDIYNDVVGNVA